jgi:hypothetical protein
LNAGGANARLRRFDGGDPRLVLADRAAARQQDERLADVRERLRATTR